MVEAFTQLSNAVTTDPRNGTIVVLVFVCAAMGFALWLKNKRCDALSDRIDEIQNERVAEAREDTELVTVALNEAASAADKINNSMDALRLAFEMSLRARTPTNQGDS
jgi:hypothetical protein